MTGTFREWEDAAFYPSSRTMSHDAHLRELSEFEMQEIRSLEGIKTSLDVAREFGTTYTKVRALWGIYDD